MTGSGLDALAALCGASNDTNMEGAASAAAAVTRAKTPSIAPQILPNVPMPRMPQNVAPPQQLQQVMGAAQFSNPAVAALMQVAAAQQQSGAQLGVDNGVSLNAMQQLAFFQYMQAQAAASQQAQLANNKEILMQPQPTQQQVYPVKTPGVALPFGGQTPQVAPQQDVANKRMTTANNPTSQVPPQHLPLSATPSGENRMQPPPSQVISNATGVLLSTPAIQSNTSVSGGNTVLLKPPIAQRPTSDTSLESESEVTNAEDKRQLKRAANRQSAQLSRKRKKQFIDQLREENEDLRRKEQILKSIPDLIVVFDSSGRLWFVSHSVSRFLNFAPEDLEGSSFWDRLCDESVRLLKAAFMDALAARNSDMDTTPLGNGVWELRLVDKDGSHKIITLNGVVHFKGESPECVCSIRPREEECAQLSTRRNGLISSVSHGAAASTQGIRPSIKHQQSVISSGSDDNSRIGRIKARAMGRRVAQISDGDSGASICSDTASDD